MDVFLTDAQLAEKLNVPKSRVRRLSLIEGSPHVNIPPLGTHGRNYRRWPWPRTLEWAQSMTARAQASVSRVDERPRPRKTEDPLIEQCQAEVKEERQAQRARNARGAQPGGSPSTGRAGRTRRAPS
jgi:hypothetical protein